MSHEVTVSLDWCDRAELCVWTEKITDKCCKKMTEGWFYSHLSTSITTTVINHTRCRVGTFPWQQILFVSNKTTNPSTLVYSKSH